MLSEAKYGSRFFFLNSVLRPFQDYFSSYETGQSVGGRKRENPENNHLAHPQAEHVASAGLEPIPVTAVNDRVIKRQRS